MKYIAFTLSLLFGGLTFGQFKIQGKISNYPDKPVMVRINKGASDKLINRIDTDKNGQFSVNIPEHYSGIVTLTNLQKSNTLEILTDNEDVEFTSSNAGGSIFSDVVFNKGKNAIGFQKFQEYENLMDVKNNFFPVMKSMYKPGDDFYEAMIKEENRMASINPATELPLLKYYAQVSDLANANVEAKPAAEIHKNKILYRLTNDNDNLEGSGFLSKLVLDYFRYSIIDSKSQDEINNIIGNEIENLLKATDIETPRGQSVLSAVFNVLPKEQFGSLLDQYYDQANSLSCQKTDELLSNLSAHNLEKPGSIVPNIIFKEAVKDYKSLYDIKADQKIIVFWASWCPACRDEMPYLKEFYPNFKKKGGEIVAISLDYNSDDFKNATKDFDWINYTELTQWDTQGVEQYGLTSTPTLFLVDKDNKLIKKGGHISELMDYLK